LNTISIQVLVVDDHEPWRRFFSTTLKKQPEFQVVGEASDGLEAVLQAQQLQPDLILLDISLPTLNGIEAARQIRQVSPKSKILFISENRSPDIAEQALNTGAGGYVVKSDAASELLPAVKAVLEHKRFVSSLLSQHVLGKTPDTKASLRTERNPYRQIGRSALISEFLASIIEATGADFGNVQLFDSANQVLRIVAHQGFEPEFLNHFDTVRSTHGCACSTALNERCRVVVADVATDSRFSDDSRGVLLRANVRSVQSTPLIEPSGRFIGMVSTHHSRPEGTMPHLWKRVDELAASFLAKIDL
jgi:DNA-binding NarL/FixJ family response regulator